MYQTFPQLTGYYLVTNAANRLRKRHHITFNDFQAAQILDTCAAQLRNELSALIAEERDQD